MICNNCKNEINEGTLFCNFCGYEIKQGTAFISASNTKVNNSVTEKKAGVKLPKSTLVVSLIAAILALGLIYVLVNKGTSLTEQKYFKSPEDAAKYFVNCVSKNDFDGALLAFVLDEKVNNYDSVAYMKRINAFVPLTSMAPEYTDFAPLNRAFLVNQASQSVKGFTYSFGYKEDLGIILPLGKSDYEASDIYELLDPKRLNDLSLDRLDYVSPEIQDSDKYKGNIMINKEIYGYTDKKEYYALYELDGELFYGGLSFVKYKKGWQIETLNSAIAGTSPTGGVIAIDKDEYKSMIEE